jgi:DNA polymerase-3 subunit epsilon/CBS domain-containing protein
MVSQRDLLQHRARGQDMLSDALEAAQDAPSLAAAFAQVTPVASRLLLEDLDGVNIARVVSTELQTLTGRAARLCMDAMQVEGMGPPPSDWCVLVLGSGGRGESLLGADQDNALIHTGSAEDDAWFADFGTRLADLLDTVGVPRCKGDVMAASAQWRGTVSDWNHRVDDWLRRARPQDLLNVDIFFDLAPVAGNPELAHRLHTDAVRAASKTPPFLGLLAQSVLAVAPRFSLMGRLQAREGRVDLKRDGLLPLVSLARTLALRVGARSRATPERLRDAAAAGRLPDGDAARLINLHTMILTLILEQQLLDRDEGIAISSSIVLRRLGKRQQSELIKGLRHLDTMVHEVQSLISG